MRNLKQTDFGNDNRNRGARAAAMPLAREDHPAGGGKHEGLQRRQEFELEVALRAQETTTACIVYADLDQIHVINEISGYSAGDEVIQEVGRLWQNLLPRAQCLATQLSGGGYAAALFGLTLSQASDWAENMRAAIEGLCFQDQHANVTASLGVASLTAADSFQHALAEAETACRVGKDRGRNRVEIFESGDNTIVRRHAEVHEMRMMQEVLDGDRCVLYAQPIISLNRPAAPPHYEILLRIQNDEGGLTSIAAYLQAAERYQILERLDRWVVQRALQMLAPEGKRLRELGASFAINITGQSLSRPVFADFVRTAVKESAVPSGLLNFEFTETAAMRNLNATRRFIEHTAAAGARIALDDFGTGLSSLMHLKELEVQQIKIDGRFIRDVLVDSRSQALVRALVQIAEQLNLETVAEFVETAEVAAHLKAMGVTFAQGYFYSRGQLLSETLAGLLKMDQPDQSGQSGPITVIFDGTDAL